MNRPMHITARLSRYSREIELSAGAPLENGRWAMAQPLTLVEKQEGAIFEPFALLQEREAQELMDELWSCGLRPSEGTGSAGQAAAMQRHLDDMRTITFHTLKIQPGAKS